jgi:hypothetical protein
MRGNEMYLFQVERRLWHLNETRLDIATSVRDTLNLWFSHLRPHQIGFEIELLATFVREPTAYK